MVYRHDTECERYRDLPTGEMNQCSYCLIAVGARAEGWYGARKQIEDVEKSLDFLTDEQREAIGMVLRVAELRLSRSYFYPKAKRKKGKT